MRTIYKYPLWGDARDPIPVVHIDMPKGAIVRHVCAQRDVPTIWAEVETNQGGEVELRSFYVIGTGQRVPPVAVFLGTALAWGGDLVWHIYESRVR